MTAREMTPERLAEVRLAHQKHGYGDAVVMPLGEWDEVNDHIDALAARLEAAEREKGIHKERSHFWQRASDEREEWLKAAEARAKAAEAKLAALVEAVDRVAYQMGPPHSCPRKFAIGQLGRALRAARGEA